MMYPMLQRRAFRYRVYPTREQERRLLQWEGALRWLWNLANEQRLMGLARADKRYPTAFDQINELTGLRAEAAWIADVPRNVCAQLLVELDKAWQRCFNRLSRSPRWKRKGRDFLGLTEPHPRAWREPAIVDGNHTTCSSGVSVAGIERRLDACDERFHDGLFESRGLVDA